MHLQNEIKMPLVRPDRGSQHIAACSALLLWSVAMVVLVTPSLGLVLVGLRGVTLLAAATVAAGIGFGVLYLKHSEVFLSWLEGRIELQGRLAELERRARSLEAMIDLDDGDPRDDVRATLASLPA